MGSVIYYRRPQRKQVEKEWGIVHFYLWFPLKKFVSFLVCKDVFFPVCIDERVEMGFPSLEHVALLNISLLIFFHWGSVQFRGMGFSFQIIIIIFFFFFFSFFLSKCFSLFFMEGICCVTKNQSWKANANPRGASITVENRVHTTRKKKVYIVRNDFVIINQKKNNPFSFLCKFCDDSCVCVSKISSMISAKEFHQQIESLAVSFSFDGQHVFANLLIFPFSI